MVKMSFGTFIVIPIVIALQAVTMMILTPYVPLLGTVDGASGLITWISFQAWAVYFLAGCTPKMGVKALLGYAGGIVASIAIFELAGLFGGWFPGLVVAPHNWALYLAVFPVVVVVIAMEKVPGLDFVPSYFVGAGVFFALCTYFPQPEGAAPDLYARCARYGTLAGSELVACAIGLT
ncbi:MAG: DUF1097 domain-containing protein, partial [Thermoguttaceae bacterium]